MDDIVPRAGEEVVRAQHVMTVGKKPFAKMAADESGAAGDQGSFSQGISHLRAFTFY